MNVLLNGHFAGASTTGSGQYLERLTTHLRRLAPNDKFVVARPKRGTASPLAKLAWEQLGWPHRVFADAPDLAHTPYFSAPLWGRTDIVTVHDLIGLILPEYSANPRWRLYNALASRAVRRARLVIVDSQAAANDVERLLAVGPDRIRVIMLGVEPAPHLDRTEIDVHLADIGVQRPYCLYLGSGDVRKNITVLLEAIARLEPQQRPQLVIAGNVPNLGTPLFPDHRQYARQLGVDPWLRFTGRVSEARKQALYAGARMLLFPSFYEGFGFEPLEAMAHGLPVIASDATSIPEVTAGAALLLPPHEPQQWAEAIAVIGNDEVARRELIEAGSTRAAELNWPATAASTLAAYRELL